MTDINNSQFIGVNWDAEASEAVVLIAKALLNLTELFKTQNIQIDALLKLGGKDD